MSDSDSEEGVDRSTAVTSADQYSFISRSHSRSRSSSRSNSPNPIGNIIFDEKMEFEKQFDEGDCMYDWCKNLENFPIVPPFIGGTGFQIDATHGATKTPFGLFCLYITKDVVKKKKGNK